MFKVLDNIRGRFTLPPFVLHEILGAWADEIKLGSRNQALCDLAKEICLRLLCFEI